MPRAALVSWLQRKLQSNDCQFRSGFVSPTLARKAESSSPPRPQPTEDFTNLQEQAGPRGGTGLRAGGLGRGFQTVARHGGVRQAFTKRSLVRSRTTPIC